MSRSTASVPCVRLALLRVANGLLLSLAAALVFGWRILADFDNWGIQDWDFAAFNSEAARVVILKYGQWPLWNPWFCGGTPLLARPEATPAGPAFLFPLLFGGYHGIRLLSVLYLALGLAGMFRLGRLFGLRRPAAVLAAMVYMFSGPFTLHLTAGNTWVLPMGLIPWTFEFYLRAVQPSPAHKTHKKTLRTAWLLATSVCLALIWLGGAPYLLIMSILFLVIYSSWAVMAHVLAPGDVVRALLIVGTVTSGLAAVQLIPCIEYTLQYPRTQNLYAGFSLESLVYGLLNRDQTMHAADAIRADLGFLRGITHGINEFGTYIGVLPAVLFVVGAVVYFRRQAPLLLSFAVLLWLSFGSRAEPLSLWDWLHHLPVMNIMRVPDRFRIVFMLCVAIFVGLGWECIVRAVQRRVGQRLACGVGMGILAFVAVDFLVVVAPLMSQAFIVRPVSVAPAPELAFVQTAQSYAIAPDGWAQEGDDTLLCAWSSHYPSLMANQGILFGAEEIPVPRKAVPIGNAGYRGEVFLYGTRGEVRYRHWSPNILTMDVRADSDGFLVVNQNYFAGWRVRGGRREVEALGGLLAVRVNAGDRRLELFYRPLSFIIGATVSAGSVLALGLAGWIAIRRRCRVGHEHDAGQILGQRVTSAALR